MGEERPSAEAIARLMTETFHRTQSAQVTISPEFNFCNDCTHTMRGLLETCTRCGSENVYGRSKLYQFLDLRAVFFVSGCNLACRYCHNPDLLRRHQQGLSWARLETACTKRLREWPAVRTRCS